MRHQDRTPQPPHSERSQGGTIWRENKVGSGLAIILFPFHPFDCSADGSIMEAQIFCNLLHFTQVSAGHKTPETDGENILKISKCVFFQLAGSNKIVEKSGRKCIKLQILQNWESCTD